MLRESEMEEGNIVYLIPRNTVKSLYSIPNGISLFDPSDDMPSNMLDKAREIYEFECDAFHINLEIIAELEQSYPAKPFKIIRVDGDYSVKLDAIIPDRSDEGTWVSCFALKTGSVRKRRA